MQTQLPKPGSPSSSQSINEYGVHGTHWGVVLQVGADVGIGEGTDVGVCVGIGEGTDVGVDVGTDEGTDVGT